MKDTERVVWNLPNVLSMFRMLLIPAFILMFFSSLPNARIWAIVIFLVAGGTDVLDGWIARHFHQITRLGRILDPMADKLMLFAALTCLTVAKIIPLWLVLLYFLKEAAQAACGFLLMRKIQDMPASNVLGKCGTLLFYITITVLALFDAPRTIETILLIVSYATIFAAFLSYILRALRLGQIKQTNPEE